MVHKSTGVKNDRDKRSLVISTTDKEKLSKEQLTFNRLIKKIEALREQISETQKTLDTQLEYHSKNIYPIECKMLELKQEALKLLYPYYKNKKPLSQTQKKGLIHIIRGLLEDILTGGDEKPDEEIQVIFGEIEGVKFEDAYTEQFESMKEEMDEMFKRQGVHVDLGDMHKDMSQEEMMRKMKEINDQINREREYKSSQKSSKAKTKKQLEKLEKEKRMEEARNKNIGNIYKQLVKVLHPDLEQDEAIRPLKEELMKQLSVAYKNNDLHGLLKLELEWINMEGNNIQQITNDKLNIYNEVLKEQVQELEQELSIIVLNPRYEPIMQYYMIQSARMPDLARKKRDREEILQTLVVTVENLKGNDPLKEIKALINMHKVQREYYDF
jgi:hypothetical protein